MAPPPPYCFVSTYGPSHVPGMGSFTYQSIVVMVRFEYFAGQVELTVGASPELAVTVNVTSVSDGKVAGESVPEWEPGFPFIRYVLL